jgi:hypothetical protein
MGHVFEVTDDAYAALRRPRDLSKSVNPLYASWGPITWVIWATRVRRRSRSASR